MPQLSIHIGFFNYNWGLASLPYYYLLLGIIVVVDAGVLGAEPQPHRAGPGRDP